MFLDCSPNVVGIPLKTCSKCGETKPLDEFHRSRHSPDGRMYMCKPCACLKTAEWSKANPDKKKQSDKAYRAAHRSSCDEKHRAWYQKNKERLNTIGSRWQDVNRDRFLEYQRQYNEKRREKKREYARLHRKTDNGQTLEVLNRHRKRARRRNAFGTHTGDDLLAIQAAQTDKRGRVRCWWCGQAMEHWHVDHKIALAVGGSNDAGNLCLSCADCNTRKRTKSPAEFAGRLL